MTGHDLVALAERLWQAEAERRAIPQLTAELPGLTAEDAYAIQRVNHQRRLADGQQSLGYKLGLTSRAKQVAMGVAAPLWGRLTTGLLRSEEDPLGVASLIHPRVEPEIAFLLGADVDGPTATVAGVLAATEGVFPALEVLDSRYEDFRFALPDVIADNASAAAIILGGRLRSPRDMDLQLEGMVLRRDGEVVDTAAGAAVSGHPAAAVAWLAREAGGLPAGAVILSGGLTAPVPLTPGTTVTASFASLGSVTVRCS